MQLPVLDHSWESAGLQFFLISDLDGVFTYNSSLPVGYFNHLFRKKKYNQYSEKIEGYIKRIIVSGRGEPFEGVARCLFKAPLIQEDHLEACDITGEETPITPYTHEAIKNLYDIPPFIGFGFDSASFIESVAAFSKHKRLSVPLALSKGSWLEFQNKIFTGRYFFNFGLNKWNSGNKMLAQVGCAPNLKIQRKNIKAITLSDTVGPDRYFRKFVGLGGISLWMDKNVQSGVMKPQTGEPNILEMNIPETIDDMRIMANPVKHLYRTIIVTSRNSPKDLDVASKSAGQLVALGRECLKLNDEELFNRKLEYFANSLLKTLALLSKFDFPRYSTSIDFKYLELLSQKSMQKKKETIDYIIDTCIQNFPESLAEDDWLSGLT